MNFTQYLLVKLAEEGNEVGKESLKEAQFGPVDDYLGEPAVYRLQHEIIDFLAISLMLNEREDIRQGLQGKPLVRIQFPEAEWGVLIARKQAKVCHYALYSVARGLLQLTPDETSYVKHMANRYQEWLMEQQSGINGSP